MIVHFLEIQTCPANIDILFLLHSSISHSPFLSSCIQDGMPTTVSCRIQCCASPRRVMEELLLVSERAPPKRREACDLRQGVRSCGRPATSSPTRRRVSKRHCPTWLPFRTLLQDTYKQWSRGSWRRSDGGCASSAVSRTVICPWCSSGSGYGVYSQRNGEHASISLAKRNTGDTIFYDAHVI